ncbi:MAG: sporulation initiation factor Spo0A C-terminal domain-containing protein [Clostridia bacterium]|nr:sporulation initiation factor Spo0A C-terminal domain-containing protein [Clostridia bacterium]
MEKDRLIVEHRGLYLGEPNEYFETFSKYFSTISRMNFLTVGTAEELIEKCYSYEPMLIVLELDPISLNSARKASKLAKYRQSVSIGLANADAEYLKRLFDEFIITDAVVKSGDPCTDALNVLRVYKQDMKYGVNLRTITKKMPMVTDLIWNDPVRDERTLRNAISDKLVRLGVRRELAGHKYLIAAVAMQSALHEAPEPIKLYGSIAEYYDTTPAAVEKAIRYALETAWVEGDIDYQQQFFGMTIDEEKGKPTNAEFIARLALDH